jgi:protein tyrosine phosphatase (PTP) superfamily phosphohydrolase (DUF442 family)
MAVIVAAAAGVWLLVPGVRSDNFHVVLEGRVYRSGQLDAAALEAAVRRYGLRTVINLRGDKRGRDWYDSEVGTARRLGLAHHDVDFIATTLPPRPTVVRLVDLLESATEPILLHCAFGADRAGFASAVARIVRDGAPVTAARDELSLAYGHLPIGPAAEIGGFFDLYARYLDERGLTDAPETFKSWLRTVYAPYAYSARLDLLAMTDMVPPGGTINLHLQVVNTSGAIWHLSTTERGIRIGVRIKKDGEDTWRDFDRVPSTASVAPGETLELKHLMAAPTIPGLYWLRVDMVDENVTWFEDQGSVALYRPLRVE